MRRLHTIQLPGHDQPTLDTRRSTLSVQGKRMAKFLACYHVPSGGNGEPGPARGRSGVALVIVLGLLALLMITGVSFTILMRIERSGSSNLRHTSAARQMAKGGIAYVIAALNDNIGTNTYPDWPDRPFRNAEGRTSQERGGLEAKNLRLPEEIFLSVVESENNWRNVASARVMSGEAAHYLPAALRHRAEMIHQNDDDYAAPEWIPVVAGGTTIGRYAYVVLNTTGLLDANLVEGSQTNRWMGGSPAEMRLDPKVQFDVANAANFATQRKTHGRYETLPELSRKNTGLKGNELANFDVFSYSLPDLMPKKAAIASSQAAHDVLRNQTQGRRIEIGTEAKIKSQQARIESAFKVSGLNDTQARWAYLGLLDYVDADNEPAGANRTEQLDRPATEAMPLFSTVMLNVKYDYDSNPNNVPDPDDGIVYTTHQMTYRYGAIFTYPFENPSGPFKVEAKILCAIYSDVAAWADLFPPLLPSGMPKEIVLSEDGVSCVKGGIVELRSTPIICPPQPLKVPKAMGEFSAGHIEMVAGGATYNSQNKLIREVPVGKYQANIENSMLHLQVNMTPTDNARAKSGDGAYFWCEALDPRYNHLDGPEFWRASREDSWVPGSSLATKIKGPLDKLQANGILPGFVYETALMPPQPNTGPYNTLTEHLLTTPKTLADCFMIYTDGIRIGDGNGAHVDPISRQVRAHVADQPLQSVGELGYLPIGFWLTINLLDHGHNPRAFIYDGSNPYPNNVLPTIGYHPVLDYFVIGDPNKGVRGKVNLNTLNPEVMGAVFNKLPLQTESHTHTPAAPGPNIAATDAAMLAEWLIEQGPFERRSDLGRFFKDPDTTHLPPQPPQLGVKNYSAAYSDPNPIQALLNSTRATGGFGEFEREALIRNACGLLTLRGQTFTVILRADAFAPRFGMTGVKQGNVLATATAIAQVWRDTEPIITEARNPVNNKLEKTYNYPTFIQFFKILNE